MRVCDAVDHSVWGFAGEVIIWDGWVIRNENTLSDEILQVAICWRIVVSIFACDFVNIVN